MAFFLNPATFYKELLTFNETDISPLRVEYHHKLDWERLPWTSHQFSMFARRTIPHAMLVSALYLCVVFALRFCMSKRPAFELRRPLIVWNLVLAVFSFFGLVRVLEEFYHVLHNYSIYHSVCYHFSFDSVTEFWSDLFVISKIFEFGDTFFLVLRKKPLIFLHYYHHAFVFFSAYHSGAERQAAGRWYIAFNFFAHTIMYTYYAANAIGFRPPRICSMTVTSVQIVQLILGCTSVVLVYYYKYIGLPCQQSDANLFMQAIMYFSILVLFCKFFADAYLHKKAKKSKKTD